MGKSKPKLHPHEAVAKDIEIGHYFIAIAVLDGLIETGHRIYEFVKFRANLNALEIAYEADTLRLIFPFVVLGGVASAAWLRKLPPNNRNRSDIATEAVCLVFVGLRPIWIPLLIVFIAIQVLIHAYPAEKVFLIVMITRVLTLGTAAGIELFHIYCHLTADTGAHHKGER